MIHLGSFGGAIGKSRVLVNALAQDLQDKEFFKFFGKKKLLGISMTYYVRRRSIPMLKRRRK